MDQPVLEPTLKSLPLLNQPQNSIEQNRKLLRRLYEPLLLLEALTRAPDKSPEFIDGPYPSSRSVEGLRRSFVDGIAYLCASERSSDFVTATALEATPQGPVLWLAANNGIRRTTVDFLQGVLTELHTVSREDSLVARNNIAETIIPGLLHRVITFSLPRLQKYINNVRNVVETCTSLIREKQLDDIGPQALKLCDWLDSTFLIETATVLQSHDAYRLVLNCYIQRKQLLFECLDLFTSQGAPHAPEFSRLSLLLSKLGKHVTVTRKVVEATVYLRGDFHEPIRVEVLQSAPEKRFPLRSKEGTVNSILGRAFQSKVEMEEFKVRLKSLWNPDEVETILSKERPGQTIVHAELLIAEQFFRNNLQFLGGRDRYIGCSKPFCYLCDAYLRNHPAGFTVARSHQKIYTTWRCPDILETDPKAYYLQQAQAQLLCDLIEWVRKDLKKEVRSRAPRAAIPPDSTAGITSENHSVFGPFELAKLISVLDVHNDPRQEMLDMDQHDTVGQEETQGDSESNSDDGEGGVPLS